MVEEIKQAWEWAMEYKKTMSFWDWIVFFMIANAVYRLIKGIFKGKLDWEAIFDILLIGLLVGGSSDDDDDFSGGESGGGGSSGSY